MTNRKPTNYPSFPPAEFSNDNLYVRKGEYVVDRDGDILQVTKGNAKWLGDKVYNPWMRDLNKGYLRAKYISNSGDFLYYANQIRYATEEEIAEIKAWKKTTKHYSVESSGQLTLFSS